MAIEFLRCVIHSETTATRDILAMFVLQGGSSWLISLGQLVYLFEILLGVATLCWALLVFCTALAKTPFVLALHILMNCAFR